MGGAMSSKVDALLKDFLEGGESTGSINFSKSTYEARGKTIRPTHLAEGLSLAGKIDVISVSSNTIAAGFGAVSKLLGAQTEAPPINVKVRGLRVCISNDVPSRGHGVARQQQAAQTNLHEILADVEKHIAKLTVDVQDAVLEFKLAGHILFARISHLKGTPLARGRNACKWKIEHRGLQVELDGCPLLKVPDATEEVQLAEAFRRLDIELHARIPVTLSVDQLLAILDVAAAGVAIAAAEQASVSAASSTGMPLGILLQQEASLELNIFDSPLLEAKCAKTNISIVPSSTAEVCLESVKVRCGGGLPTESQQVRFCSDSCLEPLKILHSFTSQGHSKALPWADAVQILLDDPRFAQHQAWLQHAKGDGIDLVAPTKRGREEAETETQKRSRL